jgi:tartrate dehydratase alpha subunit/fumarate hydratase class I-like protein
MIACKLTRNNNKTNLDATLKRSPLDKDEDTTGMDDGGGSEMRKI